MSNISYVALSQATALTRSMDTTAHNLANATTSGYKAIHPVLESIPDGSGDNAINYVRESGTYLELADGPLMQTGNPMDIRRAPRDLPPGLLCGWLPCRQRQDMTITGGTVRK